MADTESQLILFACQYLKVDWAFTKSPISSIILFLIKPDIGLAWNSPLVWRMPFLPNLLIRHAVVNIVWPVHSLIHLFNYWSRPIGKELGMRSVWHNSFILAGSLSKSSSHLETSKQILYRWYMTPAVWLIYILQHHISVGDVRLAEVWFYTFSGSVLNLHYFGAKSE